MSEAWKNISKEGGLLHETNYYYFITVLLFRKSFICIEKNCRKINEKNSS